LDEARERILKGASVNKTDDYNERTPLFYAICQRDTELVELLLNHGANPNVESWHSFESKAVDTIPAHKITIETPTAPMFGRAGYGATQPTTVSREIWVDAELKLQVRTRYVNALVQAVDLYIASQDTTYLTIARMLLDHGASAGARETFHLSGARSGVEPLNRLEHGKNAFEMALYSCKSELIALMLPYSTIIKAEYDQIKNRLCPEVRSFLDARLE